MADLDEVSRIIGSLEAEVRAFKEANHRHYLENKEHQATLTEKMEKIEKYIEFHKGKTAMLAAVISLVFTVIVPFLKDWFKR